MNKSSLIPLLGVLLLFFGLIYPVSAVGIFRNTNGNWNLDFNNSGQIDKSFYFGTKGDAPVTGDWNNDGSSDVGVFRPSTGNWILETTKTGVVYKRFTFGMKGDAPVTGDWNNDGSSDVGVFRPSTGNWILETTKTGVVYKRFTFGMKGDAPVTGDWNNDGSSDVGVFRPSTGNWILETTKTGVVYKRFTFGTKDDIPVTGDWNGDGSSDVGVFRPSTGDWILETTKTGVVYKRFHFGTKDDIPVIGDWDNDGASDVGIYRPSTGNWILETTKTGVVYKRFHFGTVDDMPKTLQLSQVAPAAAFTSDVQSGYAPLTVRFTDQSAGTAPISYAWDFTNDGAADSSNQSPSYIYTVPGVYTVNLTVSNSAGSDSEIRNGYITVTQAPVAPVAAFTADEQSGYAPLTVRFTNQSTGTAPLSCAWDFTNDGIVDSSAPSPSYIYTVPGVYTVNLTVSNSAGSDSEIRNGYITVTQAPVAPAAAFTSDVQSGYAPLTVRFTNQSTGTAPLTHEWDFNNDGDSDSYTSNPVYTYSTPGTYTVRLTVTNSGGSDSEIKYGYITVNEVPAAPVANFISNIHSGTAPLTVRFTDISTGSAPLAYEWDFNNDGDSDSYTGNPTFTYSTPGTYTVKLTVTNPLGSDAEIKNGFITVTEGQPGGSHAGIALTFDDNSIDQWYAIRPMLQQYNARVTFFVTQYPNLDPDQVDKLRTLQADGHEIGFHGTHHVEAASYLQNHSLQEYLDYDITPGLNQMRSDGFNVVDFAYPGGSDTPEATAALQGYFGHIRDTYYNWDDTIYYEYGSNQAFIRGIGLDDLSYGNTEQQIRDGILKAKQDDTILITYAHVPVQTATGDYQLSYNRLENILRNVTDNNMKFYTVSELT